jgi:hypothetical protein
MAAVTREEILQAIDAGEFDVLIGEVETLEVDFKRSPYRVAEDAEAFELAKDIAALANSGLGGIIVVGFQTDRPEDSGLDTVATVHPFSRDMFSRDQWLGRAEQLIYPAIVGLDAEFKPSANDAERGVAIISVPAQTDASRYFLVAKEFISDDGAPGWMIGVNVRSADRTRSLGIAEIHSLLSRSLHLGVDVAEVKALVAELHAEAFAHAPGPETPADTLGDRVDRAVADMERNLGE